MPMVEIAKRIRRTSLVESVYETLVEAIVSGQLPPGTVMSSVALARQLDVSRTPVKEAIRLLAHDGLIEQVNNHKARVVRFTRDDVVEIYEVRRELEGAAAEKAARRIDTRVIAQLRREANELLRSRRQVAWGEHAIDFDLRFHDALAAACGNGRLCKEIGRYRTFVRSFCRIIGVEGILHEALREHVAILGALEARKPAAARKAMQSHIDARLQSVLAHVFDQAE